MRKLVVVTVLAAAAACDGGPGPIHGPPVVTVTSPSRGLLRGEAGPLRVTGAVAPNADGDVVERVRVNGVEATIAADGSFEATVELREGATMIETVARDARGTTASDTRTVHAGQLRPVGTAVPSAIALSMSSATFARLSAAAGPFLEDVDLGQLLAPMQPMVDVGSDCFYARLFVDGVTLAGAQIAMTPRPGGLALRAELEGIDVRAHATYGLGCEPISLDLQVRAGKVVIAGTLAVTPDGNRGFATQLRAPDVSLTGLQVSAEHIPPEVIVKLRLEAALEVIAARGTELAMAPLMNQALGALGGPQAIGMFGRQLALEVTPDAIAFEDGGATVEIGMRTHLSGSEASPGYIFTANGVPSLDAEHGFQLGLADDLANQMLAELQQLGTLDLAAPADGGTFDTAELRLTLPPRIDADRSDGRMRLVLGDVIATFTHDGAPVARAALNARVDLQIAPALGGGGVALRLGPPEIHIDALDDLPNTSGIDGPALEHAVEVSLGHQLWAITRLLVAIPLPAIAGLRVRDLAIGADEGYVMVRGQVD